MYVIPFSVLRASPKTGRMAETAQLTKAAQAGVLSDDTRDYSIDGKRPASVVHPGTADEVAGLLREATDHGRAVCPVGRGAFLHIGDVPVRYEQALCTRGLDRVIDYQPTDMTVRVQAGLSIATLQAALGESGQWLPLDPPLPERATVGGMIAANLTGPCRFSQGTVRDFLIGIRVARADGTLIKGGGQVVKNVAGYDVPKLYCGSLGTLGVIVEATFQVRPRPHSQALLAVECASAEQAGAVALRLAGSDVQPFLVELANFGPPADDTLPTPDRGPYHVFIGLAGLEEEVTDQRRRIPALLHDAKAADTGTPDVTELDADRAATLARALRDFPVSGDAALRCKVSLPPAQVAGFCSDLEAEAQRHGLAARLLARAGNGIVYCAFTPIVSPGSDEELLALVQWTRAWTAQHSGFAVVEDIVPELKARVDVWGDIGAAFPLMQRLKTSLDPHGLLNPGRFVGGL